MNGESLRETLTVIATWQGIPLNFTKIGKELHISSAAAKVRVQHLAEARMLWLLQSLETPSAGKKMRKSAKLYLTGSARSLLPPSLINRKTTPRGVAQPSAGCRMAVSRDVAPLDIRFRGRMIRTVCSLETARNPRSTYWYYGGYGKTHVELIAQTALKRIGFVFLQDCRFNRWCWSYCKRIYLKGIIQGGFVLYPGRRIFFAAERLVALPSDEFFKHYRRWLNACLGSSRKLLLRMVRDYNSAHAAIFLDRKRA